MSSQMSASEFLMAVQKQQLEHDEHYHREIARLPMPHRLQHMALHISKYFARAVREDLEPELADRTWVDTFIISVSMCNILNRRLVDLWGIDDGALKADDLRSWINTVFESGATRNERLLHFAKLCEDTSNASEKMDHIEEFPYRTVLSRSAGMLAGISAAEIQKSGDLFDAVTSRLDGVKAKNIFYKS